MNSEVSNKKLDVKENLVLSTKTKYIQTLTKARFLILIL